MRGQFIPLYAMVALALYIVTTFDIYRSRREEWFLYFILIPVTVVLGIMAFLNRRQERKGVVI